MTNPSSTPRWPLPDHRTAEQIEADRAAVGRQVSALRPPAAAGSVVNLLAERQQRAPNGTRFVIQSPAGRTGPVLAAQSELVVVDDGARPAGVAGIAALPAAGPTARVVSRAHAKTFAELRDDARTMRAAQTMANVNLIMPLGYVVKGDSFPAPTAGPGRFPGGDTDPTVRVAIIDTGRSAENRDDGWFDGVVAAGTDPLDEVEPKHRNDFFAGHGTFTAGIVRQVAPSAEIWVYRFTGPDGVGTDAAAAAMFRRAADEADRDGCRLIINASFGSPALDDIPPLALQAVLQAISTSHPQVLIVASAGNDGSDEPFYPAAFDEYGVKAVGALNSDLSPASFSNRGDWVACSTVGVGVVSTFVQGVLPPEPELGADVPFPADAWAIWSGTSFTAPQIAGAVADLCSADPDLDPRTAYDRLIQDAEPLDGFGRVVHILPGTPAG